MSRYTILWDPLVEEQFIDKWISSDSQTRRRLTEIATWVDANLNTDPLSKGKEESDSVRVLAFSIGASNNSVAFQVLPQDLQVLVIRLVMR